MTDVKQRKFSINNGKVIFYDGRLSWNRSGFPPLSEADLLKDLSAALLQLEKLQTAVANMRSMVINGVDEIVETK